MIRELVLIEIHSTLIIIKNEESEHPQPPILNSVVLNFNEVGMDNFCTFHQEHRSEKSCPQWLNSMTLVMNQSLDTKLEDPEE